MIRAFLEGETYRHPKHENGIFVLAVGDEDDNEVTLAILWVEPETIETCGHGELTVQKKDFKNWEEMEL